MSSDENSVQTKINTQIKLKKNKFLHTFASRTLSVTDQDRLSRREMVSHCIFVF